jgi:hypothetical protein
MAPTTAFSEYWQATRERLDAAFVRSLPRFFGQISDLDPVRAALGSGKRLRGCLVCLVCDALGGDFEDAAQRALAIECVHAASLIHDDVVDGDVQRRGSAATWVQLGRRRAVLLGDLVFATALARAVMLGREEGLTVAETLATMAGGAYREPLDQCDLQRVIAEGADLYPRLIYLKTGVLFGAAARLGALAAAAPAQLSDRAFELGVQIGAAYQIADDLHDMIELDSNPPDTAARLPLLAPLLLHYCPDLLPAGAPLATADRAAVDALVAKARPLLGEKMHQDINARLRAAADVADRFPSNAYTPLLQAAPAHITRAMLRGSPSG